MRRAMIRPEPSAAVAGLMHAIDTKHRKIVARQIDAFPKAVTLFAEDFDALDADSRYEVSRRCDVKIRRGPSRAEYRV